MAPNLTRYLRWRLAESGLVPRSATGKLFLYALLVALLSYLGREIGNSIAAGRGEWFNLPLVFSYLVLVPLGVFLTLRWFRNRLLWRLRNRLMVTYVFIGVIPVLLVIAISLFAGYVLVGQFATYLANSDLQAELQSLSAANGALANELAGRIQRGLARDRIPELLSVAQLGERFNDVEVDAWFRGRRVLLRGEGQEGTIELPQWLQQREQRYPLFEGVVIDQGKAYLRSASLVPVGNDALLVISSAPLDRARLHRIAEGLGQIAIYGGGTFDFSGQRREDGSRRQGVTVRFGSEERPTQENQQRNEAQAEPDPDPDPNPQISVSGGSVPPARNRFDRQVGFFVPLAVIDWASGEETNVPLTVGTRLTTLYTRLFLRRGEWANAILTAIIAVAVILAVIEFAALLVGAGLTRTITRSVHQLYEATQRINRGDFRHRIAVKSSDQLATLEKSFNSMVENLEQLIAEQKEKERLQSELAIAQEVQAQLFPREIKQLETFELHGICRPARIVSGDYYDFIPLGADRLGIAVGDISGKGISAALLMATLHSAVRAFEFGRMPHSQGQLVTAASLRPMGTTKLHDIAWRAANDGHVSTGEVMSLLNHHLYASTPPEKYATLFLGTFDGPTRQMTYTNAGHLPPLIVADDGSVRRLEEGGLVIGLFDDLTFEERTIQLHPGEIFVAYSDGITEPENEFGEFGEHRLLELVRDYRTLPLSRITDHVVEAVQAWIGGAEQPDDVTLVLARAH